MRNANNPHVSIDTLEARNYANCDIGERVTDAFSRGHIAAGSIEKPAAATVSFVAKSPRALRSVILRGIDDPTGLYVVDVRVGFVSQFCSSACVPARLFCDEVPVQIAGDTAAPGTIVTLHLQNTASRAFDIDALAVSSVRGADEPMIGPDGNEVRRYLQSRRDPVRTLLFGFYEVRACAHCNRATQGLPIGSPIAPGEIRRFVARPQDTVAPTTIYACSPNVEGLVMTDFRVGTLGDPTTEPDGVPVAPRMNIASHTRASEMSEEERQRYGIVLRACTAQISQEISISIVNRAEESRIYEPVIRGFVVRL